MRSVEVNSRYSGISPLSSQLLKVFSKTKLAVVIPQRTPLYTKSIEKTPGSSQSLRVAWTRVRPTVSVGPARKSSVETRMQT